MTYAEADTQALAKVLGPKLGGGFHQVVEAWPDTVRNDGFGMYTGVNSSLDWETAWDNREYFTLLPSGPDSDINTHADFRMVVSNDGGVHVFYETKQYDWLGGDTGIGYKRRGTAAWPGTEQPEYLMLEDCTGTSPRPYYEPQSDMLHLLFSAGWTSECYPDPDPGDPDKRIQGYRRKAVSDPEWGPLTYLHPSMGEGTLGGSLVAEPSGIVHFVGGRDSVLQTAPVKMTQLVFGHRSGSPPAAGLYWTFDRIDTLDSLVFEEAYPPPPEVEPTAEQDPSSLVKGAGDWLYFAWARPMELPDFKPREVFFAALDTGELTNEWVPENCLPPGCVGLPRYGLQLTPTDGTDSYQPKIAVDGSGRVHVIYREDPYLWHMYAEDDPTVLANWTEPEILTSEFPERAKLPSIVAEGDTLWVAYSVWETFGCTGDCRQGFFKKGYLDCAAAGDSVLWSGTVNLDSDFLVGSCDTLVIEAGTTVVAAPTDGKNVGLRDDLVEIVVDGLLLVKGTETERVTFTCSEPAKGSWGGVVFRDIEGDESVSSIKHADFEYPVFGVRLDSLACTLFKPKFAESESADIWVDRNTRIPERHEWNLLGPTTVAVKGAAGSEPRLTITINGHLETHNLTGNPDSAVVFTALPADATTGNAWNGVLIQGTGWPGDGVGTANIEDAEFEYAAYPLSFFLADYGTGARVAHSTFHHYHDEAITDWGSNATVDSNLVYRGAGMDLSAQVGRVGLHIAESYGSYTGNQIFWQGERGIWADFTSAYCDAPTPPEPPELLVIDQNDVIGTVPDPFLATGIGIDVSWACREHNVVVRDNNVQAWPKVGIKVRQSSDVTVACNCVLGNGTGLLHRRDKLDWDSTENGYSVLTNNRLKDNETNVTTLKIGPLGEPGGDSLDTSGLCAGGGANCPSAGGNVLKQAEDGRKNWHLDAGEARKDHAQMNRWLNAQGLTLTVEADIDTTNLWSPIVHDQEIVVSNALDVGGADCVNESSDCPLLVAPGEPPQSAARSPGHGAPDGRRPSRSPQSPDQPALALPDVLALRAPRPNPASGPIVLQLDVPYGDAGTAEVVIYDAGGRRVRTLVSGPVPAGYHRLTWNGRDEGGLRVASGVFFVRARIGERTMIRRIVVLR